LAFGCCAENNTPLYFLKDNKMDVKVEAQKLADALRLDKDAEEVKVTVQVDHNGTSKTEYGVSVKPKAE
jgi:Fe-S cluster assembly iron-binding protein IscA